jgi:hypothetical protein
MSILNLINGPNQKQEKEKREDFVTKNNENLNDAFFPPIEIDTQRADTIFPYKLLVIDITDGSIVDGDGIGGGFNEDSFIRRESNSGGISFVLENKNKWEFALPISPQQLSITDQYAINTTATMRGVVEEHNGIKFKIITASGTTGIWPSRNFLPDPDAGQDEGLFGGTLDAVGGFLDALDSLTGGGNKKPTNQYDNERDGQDTGYFQALLLQQFIEQYTLMKKNPANKHYRLVWHQPKTNESFIVTPLQFTVTKSQKAPNESLFNMQFKAWKRIDLSSPVTPRFSFFDNSVSSDGGFNLFDVINALDNARSVMSAALNIVKSVRADFRKVFDQIRKVALFVKDLAGVVLAIVDLPNQIIKDLNSVIKQIAADFDDAEASINQAGDVISTALGQNKSKAAVKAIKAESAKDEGQSPQAIEDGEGGRGARNAGRVSPLNNIFNEPEANFDFFKQINVDDLTLTPKQSLAIQDEIDLNSLISIEEIKEIKRDIQNLTLDISNSFGAGDAFFSEITNRPAPRERATPMTLEEFELIMVLENAVLQMNLLTATRQVDDIRSESPLEYVGGLADDSNIPFNSTSSAKYLAPVPFNLNIQEISARYLGDADRYNEIITLNNLRSPYIDEDGFFYNLLSNGDSRQFNINTKENLFIGQKVQLSSATVPVFLRKITAIEKITDTNYLISVDGLADLEKLKSNENAIIKAFLPGTVNSQNQIYIPSNKPVDTEDRTFDIPFLKDDPLTGLSKVDWLLEDSGDVVINSFGEVGLANGLTNLVQSLRTKVKTEKGALLGSPNFGLGLRPGINVTDVSIEGVLKDLKTMVLQDGRFSGVQKIELDLAGPTISITIVAILANGRGIFPINFDVSV